MIDVSLSHTSYNLKASKHVLTLTVSKFIGSTLLELFHSAVAVRIEEIPNDSNFSKIRKACKTTIGTVPQLLYW